MFQSTPAIADGRTGRPSGFALRSSSFNPRPPSLTGEPARAIADKQEIEVFQSTPAIADGRTPYRAAITVAPEMFQSTPAIADGRTMPRA